MGKPKGKAKNKLPSLHEENNFKPKNEKKRHKVVVEDTEILDGRISKKVLHEARKQQIEVMRETAANEPKISMPEFFSFDLGNNDTDEGEEDVDKDVTVNDFMDDIQINEEDERALEMFKNKDGKKLRNLADIIMEKLGEKQSDLQTRFTDAASLQLEEMDPKVKEMYEGVRDVMKRYRSGKIPKAFKIIPKLKNWEQILFLTEPHNWSAAAMFQSARIFCSGLSQNMAQRFNNLVLLPRIRDDLSEYNKLNMHLYRALQRALFKPAAFMKGIILPLLESGDCTLREAIIIGSVIAKSRIPVLHSSACLLKICEMEYSGANSIFIRIFLDKRYALPYRVVDAAVFHFIRFEHDKRDMPVLWHQSLLTFVQRYKNDISSEQKEALFGLLKKKSHPKITPEIRRELQSAKCRDSETQEPFHPSEMDVEIGDKHDEMDDCNFDE